MFNNFFNSDGDDAAENPAKEIRKLRRPKIGLALGSGVARGWAHIGVIRAMMRHGLVPDVVSGTSIGAVVGGALVTGSIDPLEKWALSLKKGNFFKFLDFKINTGGLFGAKKLHQIMKKSFGDHNLEDLETPFIAIGCELMTGHEIWMQEGNMLEAIKASFALPGVFEPVNWGDRWLVDGALVNPVPVSACRAMGAELVIAVNLSEDIYGSARASREGKKGTGKYGVYEDVLSAPSMAERRASKSLFSRLTKHDDDAPSLFANMVASLNIMQNRLSRSRLAGDPPDITMEPKVGHVGLMEFHRAEELIALGEKCFEDNLEDIRDALEVIGYRLKKPKADKKAQEKADPTPNK